MLTELELEARHQQRGLGQRRGEADRGGGGAAGLGDHQRLLVAPGGAHRHRAGAALLGGGQARARVGVGRRRHGGAEALAVGAGRQRLEVVDEVERALRRARVEREQLVDDRAEAGEPAVEAGGAQVEHRLALVADDARGLAVVDRDARPRLGVVGQRRVDAAGQSGRVGLAGGQQGRVDLGAPGRVGDPDHALRDRGARLLAAERQRGDAEPAGQRRGDAERDRGASHLPRPHRPLERVQQRRHVGPAARRIEREAAAQDGEQRRGRLDVARGGRIWPLRMVCSSAYGVRPANGRTPARLS
ncbi:hypothetical protein [Nannocystis pusilla]|uniref:hypothetical protein n=1 Tax=Nannocystis pusilla TaxID=889268 RepID=UPI003B788056